MDSGILRPPAPTPIPGFDEQPRRVTFEDGSRPGEDTLTRSPQPPFPTRTLLPPSGRAPTAPRDAAPVTTPGGMPAPHFTTAAAPLPPAFAPNPTRPPFGAPTPPMPTGMGAGMPPIIPGPAPGAAPGMMPPAPPPAAAPMPMPGALGTPAVPGMPPFGAMPPMPRGPAFSPPEGDLPPLPSIPPMPRSVMEEPGMPAPGQMPGRPPMPNPAELLEEDYAEISAAYTHYAESDKGAAEIAALPIEEFNSLFLAANEAVPFIIEKLKTDETTRTNYLTCVGKYADYVESSVFLDRQGQIRTEAGNQSAQQKLGHFAQMLQTFPTAPGATLAVEKIQKLQRSIKAVKPIGSEISPKKALAERIEARLRALEENVDLRLIVSPDAPKTVGTESSLTPLRLTLSDLEKIRTEARDGFYDLGKVDGKNMSLRLDNTGAISLGFREGAGFTACPNHDPASKDAMKAITARLGGKAASAVTIGVGEAATEDRAPRPTKPRPDPAALTDEDRARIVATRAGATPMAPVKSSSMAVPARASAPRVLPRTADPVGVAPEVLTAADTAVPPPPVRKRDEAREPFMPPAPSTPTPPSFTAPTRAALTALDIATRPEPAARRVASWAETVSAANTGTAERTP